jgi:hypothetical protein
MPTLTNASRNSTQSKSGGAEFKIHDFNLITRALPLPQFLSVRQTAQCGLECEICAQFHEPT